MYKLSFEDKLGFMYYFEGPTFSSCLKILQAHKDVTTVSIIFKEASFDEDSTE